MADDIAIYGGAAIEQIRRHYEFSWEGGPQLKGWSVAYFSSTKSKISAVLKIKHVKIVSSNNSNRLQDVHCYSKEMHLVIISILNCWFFAKN